MDTLAAEYPRGEVPDVWRLGLSVGTAERALRRYDARRLLDLLRPRHTMTRYAVTGHFPAAKEYRCYIVEAASRAEAAAMVGGMPGCDPQERPTVEAVPVSVKVLTTLTHGV